MADIRPVSVPLLKFCEKLFPHVTAIGQSVVWPNPMLKQRTSAVLNFQNVHIWSFGCHREFKICCCVPNFIKIRWSAALAAMRCLCVRLSVCPSRSSILPKRIIVSSIFSPSGSRTILVFPSQTASIFIYLFIWQYSDRNPLWGRRM